MLKSITKNPKITTIDLALAANITERTVHRVVEYLKENSLIKRIGSDRGGHWEVIEKDKK